MKEKQLWLDRGKKQYIAVCILFLGSFGLFGLFYEYASCILGALLGIQFSLLSMFQRKAHFFLNPDSILLCTWIASYGLSCFYAIDRGMAFLGFLKYMSVFFFLGIAMQLNRKERQFLLELVPIAGYGMVLLGIIGHFIPPLYTFLYTAKRFGGLFQYANALALFCLLGIFIEMEKGGRFIQTFWLLLGILLSGSRAVFLLAAAAFLVSAASNKKKRMYFLTFVLLMAAGSWIYANIFGQMQNIGRIYSTAVSSSTFLGRLLYYKDGLRLLRNHPFGLGYLGYYFLQPSIQTGVYQVRFVHNGFLQIALDVGIIPCLLFLSMLIRSFFSKRLNSNQKLMLASIAIHSLVDFDFEFTAILFVLILLLDFTHGREISLASHGRWAFYKILGIFLSLGMIYCGISMAIYAGGNPHASAKMLPFYTEAKKAVMLEETDQKAAKKLAVDILRQNPYIAEAYDVLAASACLEENYQLMAQEKEKSVSIQKYNIEAYNRYVMLLSIGIESATAKEDWETAQMLLQKVVNVEEMLRQVKEETDPLAYKLRDQPDFELDQQVLQYIETAKEHEI